MRVDEGLKARFGTKWEKDEETGCWRWLGAKLPKGYGMLKVTGSRGYIYAHRAAYEIFKGPIPLRTQVCHTCDHPWCVNPDHLFLGTSADNHRDMVEKGRQTYGERNAASKLTEQDVREIRALAAEGAPQTKIAEKYGVHQVHIGRIIRGVRWGHLAPKAKEGTDP